MRAKSRRMGAAWAWGPIVGFAVACSTFGGDGDNSSAASPDDAAESATKDDGGVVIGRGSALVDIAPLERSVLTHGTTQPIKVTIARKGSFNGAVILTVRGLPDGIAAKPLRLESPATVGDLELTVASSFPQGDVANLALEANPSNDEDLAIAPLPLFVRGAPGEIDTTFGTDGFADTDIPALSPTQTLAVLPDGRFLVFQSVGYDLYGSDSVIRRFSADGQLDPTFGDGGKIDTLDGYIVRAFVTDNAFLMFVRAPGFGGPWRVQRRSLDGVLDPNYGIGGEYTHTATQYQIQNDIVLMAGGATAIVGSNGGGKSEAFWITSVGAADSTVNASASSTLSDPGVITRAVGDATGFVGLDGYKMLARVQRAGGTLDTTFGGAGTGLLEMDGAQLTAIAVDSVGRYVVSGSLSYDVLTVRLDQKGALDPAFGKQTTSVPDLFPLPMVVVQKDDGVVQALRELTAEAGRCGLVRHTSNGALDSTFGANGVALYPVEMCRITDVAQLPDGRLLVAGAKTFRVWN